MLDITVKCLLTELSQVLISYIGTLARLGTQQEKEKGRVRKESLLWCTQSIQEILNSQLESYREDKIFNCHSGHWVRNCQHLGEFVVVRKIVREFTNGHYQILALIKDVFKELLWEGREIKSLYDTRLLKHLHDAELSEYVHFKQVQALFPK